VSLGIVGFVAVVDEPAQAASRKVPASVAALRTEVGKQYGHDLLAGEAFASVRFRAQVHLAAGLDAPLWIVGEPGSGKETAARIVHALSAARDRPFAAIDCAGLQPYLIESILFGRGGLAESDRVGVIYLKEPTALPRDLQQRLADYAAEHSRPRLMCGSTRTAPEAVAAGGLVPIYLGALAAFELRTPPLRDRLDDLPRFAARIVADRPIDPEAVAILRTHAWPGNLRELAALLTAAAEAVPTGPILRDHLPLDLRLRAEASRPRPARTVELDAVLEAVERRLIAMALRKANNNQTEAAAALGIYRDRLWRRLEALGIPVPPQPPRARKSSE
jgi:DNA-binding NtrC family response regulator